MMEHDERTQGNLSQPTVLLDLMPQQVEVRVAEDDWTGSTDAAKRRKCQNRLHQRKHRRKMKESRMLAALPGQLPHSDVPHSVAFLDETSASFQYIDLTGSSGGNQLSELAFRDVSRAVGLSAFQVQGVITQFEDFLTQHYRVSSPRLDLLLTLVQFNVFRALAGNTVTLGFPFTWLSAEADSPFTLVDSHWRCPTSLQPTELQRKVPHHPWIDLFPFPALRDNILAKGQDFDDDELCHDLVEVCHAPSERSGLIVWSNPWDPLNWEATTEFVNKWEWVLKGCPELLFSTNQWRWKRGEETILFDVAPSQREPA